MRPMVPSRSMSAVEPGLQRRQLADGRRKGTFSPYTVHLVHFKVHLAYFQVTNTTKE